MPTKSDPIYSFATLRNRLVLNGWLEARTALRIGMGRSTEVTSNDLPVIRDSRGHPFIPGASLKGAFRSRVEALIRGVYPDQARDHNELEATMRTTIAALNDDSTIRSLQRQQKLAEADDLLTRKILHESKLVELTFGAPWLAGRIFFRDALVDTSLWFGQYELRNGVAINRDTETVDEGKLYDYEVVPAGVRFSFALVMENAAPWQLGMILLALGPWRDGEMQIGGFRSRGLGYVKLDLEPRYGTYVELDPNKPESLLGFLDARAADQVLEELAHTWTEAYKQVLRDPSQALAEVNNA